MLSLAQLPLAARSAQPAPHLTSRYVPVDTREVIAAMEQNGFVVADAKGTSGRNTAFSKHTIDFRHPDVPHIGGATPRVLFVNSHDGSTRASALAGVFRFVCSNGMVVGSTYAREKVLHVGESARTLIERMQQLARNTSPLFRQIETWQRKDLNAAARRDFARFAAQLRWGDAGKFDVEDILRVRRAEDDKGDLWTVFNRVQENTTHGGMIGVTATGRQTTARPLEAVGANLAYNQQLWALAAEFADS